MGVRVPFDTGGISQDGVLEPAQIGGYGRQFACGAAPETNTWFAASDGTGIGAIGGTGISTLTRIGAEIAGPAVILSFAFAGVVRACAALAYAEMATMMPMAGSAYTPTVYFFYSMRASRLAQTSR